MEGWLNADPLHVVVIHCRVSRRQGKREKTSVAFSSLFPVCRMNHFLSALVFSGGERSHRGRHFVLCEFHRSIGQVSVPHPLWRFPEWWRLARDQDSWVRDGPGPPPAAVFLTPPPLNRSHGGSLSGKPASLRGRGCDSAPIELHESAGNHVRVPGSWSPPIRNPPLTVAVWLPPLFCSFPNPSERNKHQLGGGGGMGWGGGRILSAHS